MNKIRKLKINYIKQIFCMFWKTCSLGAYSVGITSAKGLLYALLCLLGFGAV